MSEIKQIIKSMPSLYIFLSKIKTGIHSYKIKGSISKQLKCWHKESSKKILMLLTPEYGNLGDHLIANGMTQFLTDNFPEFKLCEVPLDSINLKCEKLFSKYSNDYEFVAVAGGGFLGSLYFRVETFFRMILKSFANNRIIVFPQTVFFEDNDFGKKEFENSKISYKAHTDLHFFVRDESYSLVKNQLCNKNQQIENIPDIALYLNYSDNVIKRCGILFCLRNDKEKTLTDLEENTIKSICDELGEHIRYTDTVVNYRVPISLRNNEVMKKVSEFKAAKLVITDRLHGMIFAVITGTPCIAFNNSSGKVAGVYNLWLSSLDYIKLVNDSLMINKEMVEKMLSMGSQKYNKKIFDNEWELLKEACNG